MGDTCSGKPEKRIAKMFSWHISCVAVGLIFNINEFLSGSFVYAGAFIRPWIYYMSGKRFLPLVREATKRNWEMMSDLSSPRSTIAQQH